MIIDGTRLPDDLVVHADLCVVGSGLGATVLTSALESERRDVVVVEAGDLRGQFSRVGLDNAGLEFGLPTTRAIRFGGTTDLWHAVCARLDPVDLRRRDWVDHSGWPIDWEELDGYYAEAASLLGVPDPGGFDVERLPGELAAQLDALPVDAEVLRHKIFQNPTPPFRAGAQLRRLADRSGGPRCFVRTTALELVATESGRQVTHLLARTPSGRSVEVRARRFVVAAGALETPRLLLNSRSGGARGLGNRGDAVGRFLMDHPMGNLCQIRFRQPRVAPIYSDARREGVVVRSGFVFAPEVQRDRELPNHAFFLRPSFAEGVEDVTERVKKAVIGLVWGQIDRARLGTLFAHPAVAARLLLYKTTLRVRYTLADVFVQAEQLPDSESRVSLSEQKDCFGYPVARARWRVSKRDLESMYGTFRLLQRALPSGRIRFTHREADLRWSERFTSAAHHLGTARMAVDESRGVVNRDLRVFGVENVFLCDASVFPTAGNANPGLTIAALALRLAQHLKKLEW